jgi:hypothetical protein
MNRFSGAFLLLVLFGALLQPAEARPQYFMLFQDDPLHNPSFDTCATCHLNPAGGGPRNPFGEAFEQAGYQITPMLRANFSERFELLTVDTGKVASVQEPRVLYRVYLADPSDEVIVAEYQEQAPDGTLLEPSRELVSLLGGPVGGEDAQPENAMSFFITSRGPGNGGDLGGLAGADAHCQMLADEAGAGTKTWRAYLSTSFEGEPAINAGDRIGGGPWYNADGILVAQGVLDLHSDNNKLSKMASLDENGEVVNGRGDDPNRHDILTGTLGNGLAAVDMNCSNWTSSDEGTALLGHHDREGGGDNGTSWNSAHASRSCSQEDLQATGGDGLFYCFAID